MALRWDHRQRLPHAIAALLLAGGLASCSGTPFGDQLARSFSGPASPATPGAANPAASPTPAPVAKPPAAPAAGGQQAPSPQAEAGQADPTRTGQPGADRAGSAPRQPAAPPRQATAPPAPYRITLRLPGADPSAPAEAVTEALRSAGVSFEVEMIERVRNGTGAAGASPSATVTPAPPPR